MKLPPNEPEHDALDALDDCPDCGQPWPPELRTCPSCGLTVEEVAERVARSRR